MATFIIIDQNPPEFFSEIRGDMGTNFFTGRLGVGGGEGGGRHLTSVVSESPSMETRSMKKSFFIHRHLIDWLNGLVDGGVVLKRLNVIRVDL